MDTRARVHKDDYQQVHSHTHEGADGGGASREEQVLVRSACPIDNPTVVNSPKTLTVKLTLTEAFCRPPARRRIAALTAVFILSGI